MKFIVALALVGSCHALVDDYLEAGTFDKTVFAPGVLAAFVKFYAPWCKHCQEMAPEWSAIGDAHEEDPSLLIGSVDCADENNQGLCNRHKVTGYPTLLYFFPPDRLGEQFSLNGGGETKVALRSFAMDELASRCYPSRREKCTEEQLSELELLETMGVEKARALFVETRKHIYDTRMQMMTAMEQMRGSKDDAVITRLEAVAKEAQEVLSLIETQKGSEYRAIKAFLAPHGGAGEYEAKPGMPSQKKKKMKKKKAKAREEL